MPQTVHVKLFYLNFSNVEIKLRKFIIFVCSGWVPVQPECDGRMAQLCAGPPGHQGLRCQQDAGELMFMYKGTYPT